MIDHEMQMRSVYHTFPFLSGPRKQAVSLFNSILNSSI